MRPPDDLEAAKRAPPFRLQEMMDGGLTTPWVAQKWPRDVESVVLVFFVTLQRVVDKARGMQVWWHLSAGTLKNVSAPVTGRCGSDGARQTHLGLHTCLFLSFFSFLVTFLLAFC